MVNKLANIKITENPFSSEEWRISPTLDEYDFVDDKGNLPTGGLISVKISHRPKDKASFLFARDAYSQDYFLHYDNFKNGSWKDWCQLSIGSDLQVVSGINKDTSQSKALSTIEIYLV